MEAQWHFNLPGDRYVDRSGEVRPAKVEADGGQSHPFSLKANRLESKSSRVDLNRRTDAIGGNIDSSRGGDSPANSRLRPVQSDEASSARDLSRLDCQEPARSARPSSASRRARVNWLESPPLDEVRFPANWIRWRVVDLHHLTAGVQAASATLRSPDFVDRLDVPYASSRHGCCSTCTVAIVSSRCLPR
jgi:hypothetical protein